MNKGNTWRSLYVCMYACIYIYVCIYVSLTLYKFLSLSFSISMYNRVLKMLHGTNGRWGSGDHNRCFVNFAGKRTFILRLMIYHERDGVVLRGAIPVLFEDCLAHEALSPLF